MIVTAKSVHLSVDLRIRDAWMGIRARLAEARHDAKVGDVEAAAAEAAEMSSSGVHEVKRHQNKQESNEAVIHQLKPCTWDVVRGRTAAQKLYYRTGRDVQTTTATAATAAKQRQRQRQRHQHQHQHQQLRQQQ